MPAIRHVFNGAGQIATQVPNKKWGFVDIILHGGKLNRFPWLGFICEAGTKFLPEGAYAKMVAMEVTSGDGIYQSEWVKLEPNQFVLCWRVLYDAAGMMKWGIYGIVDQKGLPLVMTEKKPPPPDKPKADVLFIGSNKKKPVKEAPHKHA